MVGPEFQFSWHSLLFSRLRPDFQSPKPNMAPGSFMSCDVSLPYVAARSVGIFIEALTPSLLRSNATASTPTKRCIGLFCFEQTADVGSVVPASALERDWSPSGRAYGHN